MLRTPILPTFFIIALGLVSTTRLHAGDAKAAFVNSSVSSRTVAFNQAVRVEFTTLPKQIDGVDIVASVANALAIGSGNHWRPLGPPVVTELSKPRPAPKPAVDGEPVTPLKAEVPMPKPINVVFVLLPRASGDVALPRIPLTWLQGDQLADFGSVTVKREIQVAGQVRDLPKECTGVAGFAWGSKLPELVTAGKLSESQLDRSNPAQLVARPQPGLELLFKADELAAATITTPGLTIDRARISFLDRWGLPQVDTAQGVTWFLGWTRITATTVGDTVKIDLVREDVQARLDSGQVQSGVFTVLDPPVAPVSTPAMDVPSAPKADLPPAGK